MCWTTYNCLHVRATRCYHYPWRSYPLATREWVGCPTTLNEPPPFDCSIIEPTDKHNESTSDVSTSDVPTPNVSTSDSNILAPQTEGCIQITSTPIRGSSTHKTPKAASSSSNEKGEGDINQEVDVQLALSENPIEQLSTAPRLTSTLAIAIQKALGEDRDIVRYWKRRDIYITWKK